MLLCLDRYFPATLRPPSASCVALIRDRKYSASSPALRVTHLCSQGSSRLHTGSPSAAVLVADVTQEDYSSFLTANVVNLPVGRADGSGYC